MSSESSKPPISSKSAPRSSSRQRQAAYRRPRVFPTSVRQKLAQLGHASPTNDTTRENMSFLIDRLSTDLNNFKALAEHWQRKYMELESPKTSNSTHDMCHEASNSIITKTEKFETSHFENDEFTSLGTHIIGKLDSLANPTLSLIEMGPPKVYSDVSNLISASTFQVIIQAIDHMAALQHTLPTPENPLPNIYLFKPDFCTQKAEKAWKDIFKPMSFHLSKTQFNAGSSCRRSLITDVEDPDSDHYDLVLAQCSDHELLDTLHYTTLLITGMHQAVFDDPSLAAARAHLGKACERLIREMIFTRSLTSNPDLTLAVLDGLFGSFCHFGPQERPGAVLSILELAWSILSAHPTFFHPTVYAYLCFLALVLSKSDSKRLTWSKQLEACLASHQDSRTFPALFWSYAGRAYNAMLTRDEEAFLLNAALLDELLSENPQNRGLVEAWDVFYMPVHRDYRSTSPSVTSPSATIATLSDESTTLWEHDASYENNYQLEIDQNSWLSSAYGSIPLRNSSHLPQTESDLYYDELGRPFVPGENLKAIYRISVQLMRAEASLIFQDHETCTHWVDEAEKTMQSVPLSHMFQRVFLAKNIIKETCPFPSGTRTVVDEFERRMLAHDLAQAPMPAPNGRLPMGALWRTP